MIPKNIANGQPMMPSSKYMGDLSKRWADNGGGEGLDKIHESPLTPYNTPTKAPEDDEANNMHEDEETEDVREEEGALERGMLRQEEEDEDAVDKGVAEIEKP